MKLTATLALLLLSLPVTSLAADDIVARGVVKKVDANAARIKLAHEPIPALKWSAMIMDFRVLDSKQIASLKPEQKVQFVLVPVADGTYSISRIEALK